MVRIRKREGGWDSEEHMERRDGIGGENKEGGDGINGEDQEEREMGKWRVYGRGRWNR